jgi:hypothetical protein
MAKQHRTRYAYNDSTPKNMATLEPEAPADRVRDLGTVKAQLIGKLGSRGYGRLLAQLREQTAE